MAEIEPASTGSQRRILVVDDSSLVRLYYRDTLEKAGFQVEQAINGIEAMEKVLAQRGTPTRRGDRRRADRRSRAPSAGERPGRRPQRQPGWRRAAPRMRAAGAAPMQSVTAAAATPAEVLLAATPAPDVSRGVPGGRAAATGLGLRCTARRQRRRVAAAAAQSVMWSGLRSRRHGLPGFRLTHVVFPLLEVSAQERRSTSPKDAPNLCLQVSVWLTDGQASGHGGDATLFGTAPRVGQRDIKGATRLGVGAENGTRWRHTAEMRDRYGYRFSAQPDRFAFTVWL